MTTTSDRNPRLHKDPFDMAKAEPSTEEKMDAWGKRMDALCGRMDKFLDGMSKKDKRTKTDDDEDGEAEPMASDDSRSDEGTDDPSDVSEERLPAYAKRRMDAAEKENRILEAQNRADQVARHWGKRAQLAMVGEPLRSYRRRLLKPFQQYSPDYKAVDLNLISDPKTFDIAEKVIFADAVRASSDNSQQLPGVLRQVDHIDQSGRTVSEFVGSWRAAMAPFLLQPLRVRGGRINKNPDNQF
jgi:hypothetical protein